MTHVRQIIKGSSLYRGTQRTFTGHLSTTIPVITGDPFTVMVWFYLATDPGAVRDIWRTGAGAGDGWELKVDAGAGGDSLIFRLLEAGVPTDASTPASSVVYGQWNHACGLEISTADHRVFLNGSLGTVGADESFPAPPTSSEIGLTSGGTTFGGELAWVTVWNAALTRREIAEAARGRHHLTIRPQSIISCVACVGFTPEPDLASRSQTRLWTVNGTDAILRRALPQVEKYFPNRAFFETVPPGTVGSFQHPLTVF